MLKRIISAAIGISAIIAVILLSLKVPICIDIFVATASALSIFEFTKAVKTLNLYQISIISIAFAFAFPMLVSYGLGTIVCFLYAAFMLSVMVLFHTKITFKDFAYTYSMTMIITLSLSCIIMMKNQDVNHSTFYFVISLATPWLADAGGYFGGYFFGKHKMCPNISPKKTIEGAVGGVIICILGSVGVILLFDKLIYGDDTHFNYINTIIIAAVGSLLSIIGDLSFSVIKRSYHVKDYGDIIPGHGGILDRVDSLILFIPFLYIMTGYIPIII